MNNNTHTTSVAARMMSDWVDIKRKLEPFIMENISEDNLDRCYEALESLGAIIKEDADLKIGMREIAMGR